MQSDTGEEARGFPPSPSQAATHLAALCSGVSPLLLDTATSAPCLQGDSHYIMHKPIGYYGNY